MKKACLFVADIYLTAFTLFFRVSADSWARPTNIGKGVAGVAVIDWLILSTLWSWGDVLGGHNTIALMPRWANIIIALLLCFVNRYLLISMGFGLKFERDFGNLTKSRKVLLIASFALVLLVIICLFFWSAAYHRALTIPSH